MTARGATTASRLKHHTLHLCAFLLPALALVLPSGYSWGAALLVLLGMASLPAALKRPWPTALRRWAWVVGAMGLVWTLHSLNDGQLLRQTLGTDRAAKYGLMLLAIPALLGGLADTRALRWGCWVGAWSAGLIAIWQWIGSGWERAAGHTNAIQFGNLALLLALWSWVWLRRCPHRQERTLGWLAVACGAFACVASGSRGGWVVAPLLVVMVLWLDRHPHLTTPNAARRHRLKATLLVGAVCASLALLSPVQQRAAEALQEWQQWQHDGHSNTSVGQRLAHWQLAWQVGLERPLLGWGQQAYDERKQQAVERGEAPAPVKDFNHAHNEWLDMFAKRGLLGVVVLAAFFAVPGWICWTHLRPRAQPHESDDHRAAALCGLLTVTGYVGFGMTQVMFAHNNGNMMYLFMNLLWLGVLATPTTGHSLTQARRT